MDDADYKTIQALARCYFHPGSWAKRFVRDLATFPPEKELSEKQHAALARVAWHYRAQLAKYGVAVVTHPPGVGPDETAIQARDRQRLKDWNEGKPL